MKSLSTARPVSGSERQSRKTGPRPPHAEVPATGRPRSTRDGAAAFEAELHSAPQDEDGGRSLRPALTLATFLPYRLSVVSAVVSGGLARQYEERYGIGVPEWRVLATVGEFGSITATAIGLHAHMGKVKVSRAAAALEARDLIRRRPNAEDRREVFLVLTPAGRRMYGEIAPLALDYVERLTAELPPDELAVLTRLLERLQARAVSMKASGPLP